MNYLKIKKNAEFSKLFKRGERVFSPALTLIYFPAGEMRLGIALSKKHGKAVKRNYLKRIIRELFNKYSPLLEQNYSIIVLPKRQEEYSYQLVEASLKSCIKKINLCGKPKKS